MIKTEKHVLVTGGCGYIGSHVCRQLFEDGFKVVVLDNLSTGFKEALLNGEELVVADLADERAVDNLLKKYRFSAVMHFAASLIVPESVENPLKYYFNNTVNTLSLIKGCLAHQVGSFIFSSTAAVYKSSEKPVAEDDPTEPESPYGRSKLFDEWMIKDVARASALKYVILRYFNVAGAEPNGRLGHRLCEAPHLIKVACRAVLGKKAKVTVFGDDYPTPDGTGVRDYIHVEDLARAHVDALRYLLGGGSGITLNCGIGQGYSVKEVLDMVEKVSNKKMNIEIGPRRPGDLSSTIAKADKIREVLSWKPKFSDLATIVKTALAWEESLLKKG